MQDTHSDSLQHLLAAHQHARVHNPLTASPGDTAGWHAAFVEPVLTMLGWRLPSQFGEVTLSHWPAHTGLAPAYVCSAGGMRRFMVAATPCGADEAPRGRTVYLLRRRAWSAGMPLAVFADTQHIAVYDTRLRPEADARPHVACRLQLGWNSIISEWETLAGVLSKQAVASGEFDAFAYAPGETGASAMQAFVSDTRIWAGRLGVTPRAARTVLDGVVFLAMALARTYKDGAAARLFREAGDIRSAVADALLRATTPWGDAVFAESRALLARVDGTGLRTVVTELFEASPYDLAWLPEDVLGHIYEASFTQAANTGGRHQRKACGAYYTPAPVVRHIVRHMIRRLLPSGATWRLVSEGPDAPRVLDPSCGAGAFVVEVYRALCDATLAHYLRSDPLVNPRLVAATSGVWRLTLAEKCRILTAHVFGVDIDPEAVAVTRRALWLAALSEAPCGDDDLRLGGARGMPALQNNIRCGNMLIAPDFAETPGVSATDVCAARAFHWPSGFARAAAAGGFAAVVGNPPYGVSFSPAQKVYLKTRFAHQGDRPDSYLLFMERALSEWVQPDGWCGWVIPNPWLTNIKQRALRKFVLQTASVEQIVHFGCAMFKSKAVVDIQIVLLRRRAPGPSAVHTHRVGACAPSGHIDLASATTLVHEQAAWLAQSDAPINIFVDEARRALAAKIQAQGPAVSTRLQVHVGMKPYQVGKGRPKQTAAMVQSRVYDVEKPSGADCRRYLRGADIRPFAVLPVQQRWLRYGPWLAEPRLAANFDAAEKLVMRQTSDHLVAAIDTEKRVCMNNLHVLTPRLAGICLDGFMGVFNSRLLNWYYQILNPERGEALAEVKKHHVENLPVPDDATALAQIGNTARSLTHLMHEGACAACAAARTLLDRQVYELFHLDAEEIALIEQDG